MTLGGGRPMGGAPGAGGAGGGAGVVDGAGGPWLAGGAGGRPPPRRVEHGHAGLSTYVFDLIPSTWDVPREAYPGAGRGRPACHGNGPATASDGLCHSRERCRSVPPRRAAG